MRIAWDHFETSHAVQRNQSVKGRSLCFKGVDDSSSDRRQCHCHTEEEPASIERALASFHAAVSKDYGLEEAARAAEDWIEELEKTDADEYTDWRPVTIRAAHRLALRMLARHPYYS